MLKGNNEMILSESTMIVIVQEWLDRETMSPFGVVKAVEERSAKGGVFRDATFTIKLEEAPAKEQEDPSGVVDLSVAPVESGGPT